MTTSISARVAGVALLIAFLSLASFVRTADADTPRHPPGAYSFGPQAVWTDGSVNDLFQAVSDPMPSSQLVNARILLNVTEATSANLRTRPALRYSVDGVAWDAPTAINATFINGNAVQPGTTFVDLSALGTPKPWVQFGVQVHNNTAGVYELGHVVLIVEPKGR